MKGSEKNTLILQGKDFLRDVKNILKSGNDSVLSDIQRVINELKIDPNCRNILVEVVPRPEVLIEED